MKNPVRVLAGLRSAVDQARRMVEANEHDIENGHKFEHFLARSKKTLFRREAKLRRFQDSLKRNNK